VGRSPNLLFLTLPSPPATWPARNPQAGHTIPPAVMAPRWQFTFLQHPVELAPKKYPVAASADPGPNPRDDYTGRKRGRESFSTISYLKKTPDPLPTPFFPRRNRLCWRKTSEPSLPIRRFGRNPLHWKGGRSGETDPLGGPPACSGVACHWSPMTVGPFSSWRWNGLRSAYCYSHRGPTSIASTWDVRRCSASWQLSRKSGHGASRPRVGVWCWLPAVT
jgi:hypothetical protein